MSSISSERHETCVYIKIRDSMHVFIEENKHWNSLSKKFSVLFSIKWVVGIFVRCLRFFLAKPFDFYQMLYFYQCHTLSMKSVQLTRFKRQTMIEKKFCDDLILKSFSCTFSFYCYCHDCDYTRGIRNIISLTLDTVSNSIPLFFLQLRVCLRDWTRKAFMAILWYNSSDKALYNVHVYNQKMEFLTLHVHDEISLREIMTISF